MARTEIRLHWAINKWWQNRSIQLFWVLFFFSKRGWQPKGVCILFHSYATNESEAFLPLHRTATPSLWASTPSTRIDGGGVKRDLAVNSFPRLKISNAAAAAATMAPQKDTTSREGKIRGRALERKCAKAQRLCASHSPRRRPAVGSKRGLLMFQPYLCKSHFAVQSQWLIARSRCFSLSLSHSPAPLRTRSSTWHPSQEFPSSIICVG